MTDRARGAGTLVESGVRQLAALVRLTAARLLDRRQLAALVRLTAARLLDRRQLAALVRLTAARLLDRSYYDMLLPTPFGKFTIFSKLSLHSAGGGSRTTASRASIAQWATKAERLYSLSFSRTKSRFKIRCCFVHPARTGGTVQFLG